MSWGRKAIDLNPKGPPWHKLGLATATFGAGDYAGTVAAMEDAPPHHKKFVYLAAAHLILGEESKARLAADTLREYFPDYTLAGDMDFPISAGISKLIDFASKAGVPEGRFIHVEDGTFRINSSTSCPFSHRAHALNG